MEAKTAIDGTAANANDPLPDSNESLKCRESGIFHFGLKDCIAPGITFESDSIMKDPKSISGRWWIFGKEKPEHFGNLQYSSDEGLKLKVNIAQPKSIHEVVMGNELASIPDVIHGRDSDDRPITLFGCSVASRQASMALTSFEFHPLVAIFGQEIDSWNTAIFQNVRVYFSLLHEWFSKSRIRFKSNPGDIPLLDLAPNNDVVIKLGDNTVMKINSVIFNGSRHDKYEISESHHVSFQFPDRLPAKLILTDYVEVLRRLFTILVGAEVATDNVLFEVPDGDGPPILAEFFQRNPSLAKVKRGISSVKMTVPYHEITETFPQVVFRWFEYHTKLRSVLDLFFAVRFNPSLYINQQFIFLAQALEVYHGSHVEFTWYVQPKDEFRSRLDRIIAVAPTEEKEWLNEKLHYANAKTLAQKLDDILAKNKTEAEQFINDLAQFAVAIRKTRNYFTHFDQELKEKGKVSLGDDLILLTKQMQALLEICILKDLGISGEPISRVIHYFKIMRIKSLK